ncbi:MAG: DUF4331 domain-containing protein, partial [Deltaproteobacteria bacterium]|nr:DUF4331 domain-containing protein [Deltaproteobacteria bacterium]
AAVIAAGAGLVGSVHAADHGDSPRAVGEPAADLADLYAWMDETEPEKLNLIMTLASAGAFSDAVDYVFHVNSDDDGPLGPTQQVETNITCSFDGSGVVTCEGGGSSASGDASDAEGITSIDGNLRVFAGLRDDPFFFNLTGFNATVDAVIAAAPALTFDDDGCPLLDDMTAAQLRSVISTAPNGDDFGGSNVLALVVQVDRSLVNGNGDILGVWASTRSQ